VLAQRQGIRFDLPFIFCCFLAFTLIVLFLSIAAGSSNELAVEDEGDFNAIGAAESATAAIQPPFASLQRLGVQISAVPAEILDFFHEFDRVLLANIAHNTFGYLTRLKLIFMATRFLVMEFNFWKLCGRSTGILSHTSSLRFLLEEPC
jgi:hypothetical protein